MERLVLLIEGIAFSIAIQLGIFVSFYSGEPNWGVILKSSLCFGVAFSVLLSAIRWFFKKGIPE